MSIWLFQLFYFQIIFEGTRGTSYQGDIAIDDVSLKKGSCNGGGDVVTTVPPTQPPGEMH